MKNLQNSLLKKGKKGFTLTELAIVIAVIAILIAVLVPSFTSIINNARKTAAAEEAKSAISVYVSETQLALDDEADAIIQSGDYYFEVEGGSIDTSNGTKDAPAELSTMVAYEWLSSSDLYGNEDIIIYVKSDYATKHATTDNGFNKATTYYTSAQSAVTYSSNLTTLQAATTIYVSYIDSNVEVWWTVNSFTTVSGDTTADMSLVSGTVKATQDTDYTITVDGTAVTGTYKIALGHSETNVTVYYYTAA